MNATLGPAHFGEEKREVGIELPEGSPCACESRWGLGPLETLGSPQAGSASACLGHSLTALLGLSTRLLESLVGG